MRLLLCLKSTVQLTQYHNSMTMKKLKKHEQLSPTAGRFLTSIPASWIPQNCHRCSELSMSAFNCFCLASTLAVSNQGSLPMLLGGFLVGLSKNIYDKTSMILTQTQKDSRLTAIRNSISNKVHGRQVLIVLKGMLLSLKRDKRAKNHSQEKAHALTAD